MKIDLGFIEQLTPDNFAFRGKPAPPTSSRT